VQEPRLFEQRMKKYNKPHLLVIDGIGYLSFDDLLVEVITRRYETSSVIVTTNIAFKDWDQIFPAAACLTAMIDRLTHHCHIVTIQGNSFRHKESSERNQKQ
jgi:DNA replication protein DnaC